jgi:hypothetical protein
VTENPNTQPDADAGLPPGATAGEPAPAPVPPTPPAQEQQPAAENPWAAPEDDTEFGDLGDPADPADPNAPGTGVAATFLPGIEAGSVLALLLSLLAAGAYLLVSPLVQARDAHRTWWDFKNNVPRARQDPFGVQRDWLQYQSWTHIILGLLAIVLALLILGLWTAQKNKLYSRAFAQAALVLGLCVVLYGILLKTGAVGSQIPSMNDIGKALSSQQ